MKSRLCNIKIPRIGLRIQKSALSVLFCYIIYILRGHQGICFYSMLAALWCIRPYIGNTLEMAIQRTTGTLVGALYGLIVIMIKQAFLSQPGIQYELGYFLLVSLTIIPIIQTTLLLNQQNASYFSCVVFLSIVVIHIGDASPILFVWQRVLDTMIGIGVGIGINSFRLPTRKRRDILFVSGVDDTLIGKQEQISTYSKRELNAMIDDGANFTISTMRTPAALMKVLDGIHLQIPIIAMDGAVLYDFSSNTYVKSFVISSEKSKEISELIKAEGLNCFANVIIDDCLLIFYQDFKNEVEKKVFETMHTSPYRNYINANVPENVCVVYFMLLAETECLQRFYELLQEKGYGKSLKILFYASEDYPGYSYIKIYNKNTSRENMLDYLKKMTGLEKTVTFGSILDKYDIIVKKEENDKVAKTLRQMYAVPFWKGNEKHGD